MIWKIMDVIIKDAEFFQRVDKYFLTALKKKFWNNCVDIFVYNNEFLEKKNMIVP